MLRSEFFLIDTFSFLYRPGSVKVTCKLKMKNEKKNCDSTEVKNKFKRVMDEENEKNKEKNKTITIDDEDCVCPACPTQAPVTTACPTEAPGTTAAGNFPRILQPRSH